MPSLDLRTTKIDAGIVDVVVLAPSDTAAVTRSATSPAAPRATRSTFPWRVLTLRRAEGTRCTGAWEIVHGRIEANETPADAARREVREETGLEVQRLYSLAVNPFYLHQSDTVHFALVFAAVVAPAASVALGVEHDAYAWRSATAARRTLTWPREHQAVDYAMHLLRTGDAGAVEDVLRIPGNPSP